MAVFDEQSGTVESDYFLYWVKNYLCPFLGRFEYGEARSVVYMDNASTHMSEEVEDAISSCGAISIHGPPYSPHINPIEKYFGKYKAYLKCNNTRVESDWYSVHTEALNIIDREDGIKYYSNSGIPGSKKMLTSSEYQTLIQLYNNN